MANDKEYANANFTAGDSPADLNVQSDLGSDNIRGIIICDGPGIIAVSVSRDSGASFSDPFPLGDDEDINTLVNNVDVIRIVHTGVDSAYRVLAVASASPFEFNKRGSRKVNDTATVSDPITLGTATSVLLAAANPRRLYLAVSNLAVGGAQSAFVKLQPAATDDDQKGILVGNLETWGFGLSRIGGRQCLSVRIQQTWLEESKRHCHGFRSHHAWHSNQRIACGGESPSSVPGSLESRGRWRAKRLCKAAASSDRRRPEGNSCREFRNMGYAVYEHLYGRSLRHSQGGEFRCNNHGILGDLSMATYQELYDLGSDKPLQDRVAVAVLKAAQIILTTTPIPSPDRVSWAAMVMSEPVGTGRDVLRLVLAANDSLSVAQIQGASDAAIQTNIDDLVDALVLAHASS